MLLPVHPTGLVALPLFVLLWMECIGSIGWQKGTQITFGQFWQLSAWSDSVSGLCFKLHVSRMIRRSSVEMSLWLLGCWTNQNGGAGDGNPMLMLPPAVRAMQDSGWKLATLARPSKNETQTVQTLRALNVWEIISNLSIKHTQKSKWTIRLFRASVKIVCSPNSLEALKEWGTGGFDAKFVPLTLLGSFALQKTAGWGGGTIF